MNRLVTVLCLGLVGCVSVADAGVTEPTEAAIRQPTTSTSTPPTTTAPPPTYSAAVDLVSESDLPASWRTGCPVDPDELRRVELAHWGFSGAATSGVLIAHEEVADDLVRVFEVLFDLGFPIERMEPVDRYGGDDDASMAANNTSVFNCRNVTGGSAWSQHSYGWAIDINPVQNPYVRDVVLPPAGERYLDRQELAPGMVTPQVVAAFEAIGWSWGGVWSSPDYQHFSKTGR